MQRFLTGKVMTNGAKDTSVVEVASWRTHRLFRKRYKTTKRFLVQNTDNAAEVGQTVVIAPCRPISKMKRWTIVTEAAILAAKKSAFETMPVAETKKAVEKSAKPKAKKETA